MGSSVFMIPPVPEEVLTKTLPGGGFQETGRDDLIGINILDGQGDCRGGDGLKFIDGHHGIRLILQFRKEFVALKQILDL